MVMNKLNTQQSIDDEGWNKDTPDSGSVESAECSELSNDAFECNVDDDEDYETSMVKISSQK